MEQILLFNLPLNLLIPIGISLIILLMILIFFIKKNRDLKVQLSKEKTRLYEIKKKLLDLQIETGIGPEETFKKLNSNVREFFKEYLNLDYSLTYLELEKIFSRQNKQEFSEFCKTMVRLDYSGEKNKIEELKKAIKQFITILDTLN